MSGRGSWRRFESAPRQPQNIWCANTKKGENTWGRYAFNNFDNSSICDLQWDEPSWLSSFNAVDLLCPSYFTIFICENFRSSARNVLSASFIWKRAVICVAHSLWWKQCNYAVIFNRFSNWCDNHKQRVQDPTWTMNYLSKWNRLVFEFIHDFFVFSDVFFILFVGALPSIGYYYYYLYCLCTWPTFTKYSSREQITNDQPFTLLFVRKLMSHTHTHKHGFIV